MDNACFSKTGLIHYWLVLKMCQEKAPELQIWGKLHWNSPMKPIKKNFSCPGTDFLFSNVKTGENELSWKAETYVSRIGHCKINIHESTAHKLQSPGVNEVIPLFYHPWNWNFTNEAFYMIILEIHSFGDNTFYSMIW